ncbi:MAG TPA: M20/M25/M40 family metallo-hydrolase, partial [Tepidisphaeraceae bacterium]|nr:M20/M25/M40 family metallo-hydrolase [Tepidisphaeraceae bacterium]
MPLDVNTIQSALSWIDSQRDTMLARVKSLCEINSYTANAAGVNRYLDAIEPDLRALTTDIERIKLDPVKSVDDNAREVTTVVGDALLARARPDAPFRVLLNIHSDTVYPESDEFPVKQVDANTLNGPGVIDARGGLVVMLTALAALEKSKFAPAIGWDVLINPDEEIGSPASAHLLREA